MHWIRCLINIIIIIQANDKTVQLNSFHIVKLCWSKYVGWKGMSKKSLEMLTQSYLKYAVFNQILSFKLNFILPYKIMVPNDYRNF